MPNLIHTINLSDYLSTVKTLVNQGFDHDVWVICEIQNISHKAGHYYFELGQSEQTKLVANCRGTLWRSHAQKVLAKFQQATGGQLNKGIMVKLQGRASFHAVYGFSFNIIDIDPTYTLGEVAKAYLELKNRLIQHGLFDLNKRLPLPFDIQKVAVIAPKRGAGLGDFRVEADRLQEAGVCYFDYYYATFQGDTAPASIRLAIGQALTQAVDILVIIRGGGAVTDLAYLNDYELSALLCEACVPVWVGIGHERDGTILDEIAHTSFDTPSKVIFGIEKYLSERWRTALMEFDKIRQLSQMRLHAQKTNMEQALHAIKFGAKQRMTIEHHQVNAYQSAIKQASLHQIGMAYQQITYWRDLILSHHPNAVLQQGYAIIKKNNQSIISIAQIQKGDKLDIQLQDGKISAIVK